jgi:hypothetical protein
MSAREFTSKLPRVSRDCEFIHKAMRSQRDAMASNRRAIRDGQRRGGHATHGVFFGPR